MAIAHFFIKSNQDIVILKTSLGAITVNGAISSYDDVSLAALKNVVVGKITSEDGGVALISATETVTPNGAISSMEDVTIGAAKDLVVGKINS